MTIGAVTVELSGDWPLDPVYRPFLSTANPPQIHLRRRKDPPPILRELQPLFCPPRGIWDLCRFDDQYIFRTYAPEPGHLDRVLVLKSDFSSGELFAPDGSMPFSYPLDEILVNGYLAADTGIMIHACGLYSGEGGWLFPGCSGAGKSTLARLAKETGLFHVLSDDRIIVRPCESGFRMYGTPWHGDTPAVSPHGAALRGIYFLRHALTHRLVPLSLAQASARLFANSFSPLWDREACARNVSFCQSVVATLGASDFGFQPDRSALEFLQHACTAAIH